MEISASSDDRCNCDPAKKFLREFLGLLLDPQLKYYAMSVEFSESELLTLKSTIVEFCIEGIDLSSIIHSAFERFDRNKKILIPPLCLPNEDLEKHAKVAFDGFMAKKYGKVRRVCYPDKFLVDWREIGDDLPALNRPCRQLDNLRSSCYNTTTEVYLNPNFVALHSIKWSLDFIPLKYPRTEKCHTNKIVKASVSISDKAAESTVVSAMAISNVLNATGYYIETLRYQSAPLWLEESEILVTLDETHPLFKQSITKWVADDSFYVDVDNSVIPYTLARVTSILDNYESLVKTGDQPPLIPIDDIDLSVLTDKGEEVPLLMMLFYWPLVYQHTVNIRDGRKIDILFLMNYAKTFAKRFEAFYSNVKVIKQGGARHTVNATMARIYLLMAIRNVFTEFSDVFGTLKSTSV